MKTLCAALILTVGQLSLAAEGELKVGDKAPAFQSTDDQGNTWKSADHVGKNIIVVYFYPADFTGGCTRQACGFRDDFKTLADKGVTVLGISGDSAETHALFKKHHKLPFTLLADTRGEIAKAFGVPTRAGGSVNVETDGKTLTLKRALTINRWTFVIDKDGKIAHKNDKVNAGADSKEIIEVVEKLSK